MFSFSEEVCLAYEAIPVPLAYFQRSEDKIVPILVSDGLCKMMHADRPDERNDLTGRFHPRADKIPPSAQT